MRYSLWIFLIILLIIRLITTTPHYKNDQMLKMTAVLYSEPSTSGSDIIFNLSGIRVIGKGKDIHYGDKIEVVGKYEDGTLTKGDIKLLQPSTSIFTTIRTKILSFYQKSVKQPNASLIGGITIGAKSALPKRFSDKLKATGTSHIVVASGMNITMLAEFVLSILLLVLTRRKALIITITCIWLYTLITGFEAPIIRAAVMASIAFTSQIFGKVGNTLRITTLTGLAMLIFVPSWIKDVGFLLSFSTTVSLILFQAKVANLLKFLPSIIKEDLTTSIAAQIGSTPIILYFFGRVNLLSPLINTLILWIVAPVMIVGAVAGALSFISPGFAKIILLTIYPLTAWFIFVVNFFG